MCDTLAPTTRQPGTTNRANSKVTQQSLHPLSATGTANGAQQQGQHIQDCRPMTTHCLQHY